MDTSNIYRWVFGVLCFSLPFDGKMRIVASLALIVLAVLFLITVKKHVLSRLKHRTVIAVLIFVVYIFLLCLLGQDTIENNLFLIKKLALLPILFILALPIKNTDVIKKSFILGVAFAIIISLIRILYHKVFTVSSLDIAFGHTINKLLVTERVYLGFMSVISFIWSLDYIKKNRNFVFANLGVLLFFLLFVGARISLLTVILITVIKLIHNYNLKKVVIYFFAALGVLLLSFAFSPSLQKRFLHTHKKGTLIERIKKWEHRVTIWECSIEMLTDHTVRNQMFGYQSFSLTKEQLVKCYENIENDQQKRDYFVSERFNTHNQYLDVLLSAGVLGLSLIGLIFYYFFKTNKNAYTMVLAFILLAAVENFLHRQIGVYLLAVTIIVAVLEKPTVIHSNEKN